MNGKLYKNIGIFALALFLLSSAIFADLSVSNITVLPSIVRPGTTGVVSMTVSNADTRDATSVIVEASGTGYIHSQGSTFLGDFRPSSSGTATVPFSVPLSTPAGVYQMTVKFSWVNATGTAYKTIQTPITVTNPAIFSLEALDKTVYTTGDFEVNIRISNNGGAARNIRFSINSSQFLQTGPNPLVIGNIGVGESNEFVLGVTLASNITSGTYSVPVTIIYLDEAGGEQTSAEKLRLVVKRKSPRIDLSLEGGYKFVPGYDLPLKLKVFNNGDETAYDVRIEMATAKDCETAGYDTSLCTGNTLTTLGATYASVGDLAPGDSKLVTLDVGVSDVATGFYRQYMAVNSKDENGDSRSPELLPLGINVEGLSDVSVFVSANPAPLVVGGDHSLSVLVSNVGTSSIKALTVGIEGDAFVLQEAQDKQFIGGLVEDDFSTVQYKVKIPANTTPGIHNLDVNMKFRDSYNKEYDITQTIELKILGADAAGGSGDFTMCIFAIVGAVVLIAALYWYFYMRKEKKK
ncbi:MAG: hypothetical protein ABIH83_01290 [Candidatus Micrarchaeota archaeon]